MTDTITPLAKAMGLPPQSLRCIAKVLGASPETVEGVALLVAFSHLQSYAASEVVLGILLDHKHPTVVGVLNREWALIDEALMSLQDGAPADIDAVQNVFEQHTVDVHWIASSLLETINAATSPAAPPQPPSTAGGDQTASVAESP